MNLRHFQSGTVAAWNTRKGTFTYVGSNKTTGSIVIRYEATLDYDYIPEAKLMKEAHLIYRHQYLMDTHKPGDNYEFCGHDGVWKESICNDPNHFTESLEYRRVPKDLVMCYDPAEPKDVKTVYVTTTNIASAKRYHVFNSWRA